MGSETWYLSIKPTFLSELLALPPKEVAQINKKLLLLTEDPTPDAKTKKQLKYLDGKLHRLRAGDYRIFYTFEQPNISVLALRRRDDTTYDEEVEPEKLRGIISEFDSAKHTSTNHWERWLTPEPKNKKKKSAPLPRAIDDELLNALSVPKAFRKSLTAVATEDDLLDCPVPGNILDRIMDAVLARPLEQIVTQPDLVVDHPDDLVRFREGELLGFLLRLNPEQEKFVTWAVKGKGATLLKGGPGTGKSTVALYRVREMLHALQKNGVHEPHILFTTYTKALTRVSEQLLESLLGEDARFVDVRTADAIAREIASSGGKTLEAAKSKMLREILFSAIEQARYEGNALKVAAQQKTIHALDRNFLLEEIQSVIEARGLTTLAHYMEAVRPGRGAALNKTQREAVWRVREAFVKVLASRGLVTWEQIRALAAHRVETGEVAAKYDAVLIDEAQDLQPTALRVLVGLCKTPGGLFLTADANQSIYGGSFRWSDVHASLQFQGRTGILKANHRSTREIAIAAESYLRSDREDVVLDAEDPEARYVHTGPLPAVRAVRDTKDETKILARFFRSATRELRLGLGACAVLCPYNDAASRIAGALTDAGMSAAKVDGDELDLKKPGIKVLTLKSAKGLEFPIVAMAGYLDEPYPNWVPSVDENRMELFARERRTMYVAMTRPMRALLLVVPEEEKSPLLAGFSPERWNMGEEKL